MTEVIMHQLPKKNHEFQTVLDTIIGEARLRTCETTKEVGIPRVYANINP